MTIINKPRKQSVGKGKSGKSWRGEGGIKSCADDGDDAAPDLWSIVNLWTVLGQRVSHISVIPPLPLVVVT